MTLDEAIADVNRLGWRVAMLYQLGSMWRCCLQHGYENSFRFATANTAVDSVLLALKAKVERIR